MRRLVAALLVMALTCTSVVAVWSTPAAADSMVDWVDIGEGVDALGPTESTHDLQGWGPPVPPPGSYGSIGDYNCRTSWYDNQGDNDPGNPGSDNRAASFTLSVPYGSEPTRLRLRILDGLTDDSFEACVNVNGGLYYTYIDVHSTETWIWHEIDLSSVDVTGAITITLHPTGNAWSNWGTYGQLAVDRAELYAETIVADSPPAAPGALVATAVSSGGNVSAWRVYLNWWDNADNELGFVVERKNRPKGHFHQVGSVYADVTTYDDANVLEGETYYYRVRAWNYTDSGLGPVVTYSDYSNEDSSSTVSGGGCFVATAAHGSYLDDSVESLRRFRDTCLQDDYAGSAFARAYYRLGPSLADFIDDHAGLKPLARTALLPAVATSTAAGRADCAGKVAAVAALAMVTVFGCWYLRRRMAR